MEWGDTGKGKAVRTKVLPEAWYMHQNAICLFTSNFYENVILTISQYESENKKNPEKILNQAPCENRYMGLLRVPSMGIV